MVGGFGKEILNVSGQQSLLNTAPPSHLCRVLGKSIDSSSHPLLEFGHVISSVSQCCQSVVPFVQEKFNQMSQSYTSVIYQSSSVCLVPWSAKCRNFHLRLIDHLLSQSYLIPSNHFTCFVSCERTHHCLSLTDLFSSTSTHYPRFRSRNPKQHPGPACLNGRYPCHRQ